MKIINTIISLIIGAGVGSSATYYFMPKPSTTETIFSAKQAGRGGTDKYEIRWYGKPKNQYWGGNYTIMKPDAPMEIVNIPKSPHIVKIQLPKQSVVAAAGNVQDIKIFRNGKECGKPGIVGDGIPLNKGCQPDL
ncbi:hypothetical protein H6G54_22145 [Anabaena cylindrica FACHB-243]|uniref:Uncharacterized protein n=1 Tax=Anabaena cylindrica (strain ATCC 27899 / PCC 7122) TaxID=272123 RepID=K9ZGE1_ANACC|nr:MULTISPECIES: hypothetical protein [Anabaena]AFZ57647.1 hypothetical protein Anacy_2183 [Anabaena cylindrica PCC 7122]AZL96669.1 hypothetical protein [Anabaena sp. CCAP 1446/1C]MBD2420354.1 hypothetical protein [Anabaena cylindrica FACHB-243]MBY5285733.1 hypothetical protein [Anabaena sp. CCAP 1446/1C]MBY5310514.1 hypothetical protein [Anabaena sp. CCAP 1446/1C]